jgi:hypothetical protein
VIFEDPLDCGTAAEPILPGGGRNAFQGRRTVQLNEAGSLIGLENRFDGERHLSGFRFYLYARQRIGLGLFIPEVKLHQPPAPSCPFPKVVVKGNAGKFPLEVEPLLLPVGGIVEGGVILEGGPLQLPAVPDQDGGPAVFEEDIGRGVTFGKFLLNLVVKGILLVFALPVSPVLTKGVFTGGFPEPCGGIPE